MRDGSSRSDDPTLSRHARLREVKTHVVGPMCHVLWALDDRRRRRAEHDDAQRLRAEHGLRDAARAGQARARVSSRRTWAATRSRRTSTSQSGHGKTVIAEAFLSDDRLGAGAAHDRRRSRGALLGRDARRGRLRDAVGRLHAGDRDRGRVRGDRAGSRHGRDLVDGPRHRPPRRGRAAGRRSASRASRSGRSAAARRFPPPATGSARSAARAPGKVYRFAQIVAAAALCLEISASASMATAGSENFFNAHHERGGLR